MVFPISKDSESSVTAKLCFNWLNCYVHLQWDIDENQVLSWKNMILAGLRIRLKRILGYHWFHITYIQCNQLTCNLITIPIPPKDTVIATYTLISYYRCKFWNFRPFLCKFQLIFLIIIHQSLSLYVIHAPLHYIRQEKRGRSRIIYPSRRRIRIWSQIKMMQLRNADYNHR
jgi:hypothetical protein